MFCLRLLDLRLFFFRLEPGPLGLLCRELRGHIPRLSHAVQVIHDEPNRHDQRAEDRDFYRIAPARTALFLDLVVEVEMQGHGSGSF